MDAVEINTTVSTQNEGQGIVSTVEICRVCLLGNLVMRDLFLESEVASLSAKAMSFANVKMLPGDGLPTHVCCVCADKLESAYDFKLQVEQADTVLRERFVTMHIKEELFFDDVEVHLESGGQNDSIGEMQVEDHYQSSAESLASMSQEEKTSLLKDQLDLLRVDKLDEQEQALREQNNSAIIEEVIVQAIPMEQPSEGCLNQGEEEEEEQEQEEDLKNDVMLKHENGDCLGSIQTVEHDYILHQECVLSNEQQQEHQQEEEGQQQQQQQGQEHEGVEEEEEEEMEEEEEQEEGEEEEEEEEEEVEVEVEEEEQQQQQLTSVESCERDDCNEYVNLLVKAGVATNQGGEEETEKLNATMVDAKAELQTQCQTESRRSKRKLVRRNLETDRDSDEENYFENLNLSSRLKKTPISNKSEKIFFLCYLCDKEFLSKNVLKEHMHSHEEVRRALSLKKNVDTPQKSASTVAKSPPSGKRSNKCPYCGKQYIYIISYSKHLKKHEREKEAGKEETMPLEISFHEDEHSLDLDDYEEERRHLDGEFPLRKRGKQKREGEGIAKIGREVMKEEIEDQLEDESEGRRNGREGVQEDDSEDNLSREGELEVCCGRRKMFACEKCPEKFERKRSLRKHEISHATLKCNVCEEEFESLEKLRKHRMGHVVEGVLTGQDLEADRDRDRDRDKDKESESAKDASGYESGVKECVGNEGGAAVTVATGGSLECEGTDRNIESHRRRHSQVDYSCKVGCQRFASKDLFQRHAEQPQERFKPYKCTQCNKTFGNELTLRNHLIATNHKTFVHGEEYDPNKRIKRVAARAAQKIIDKIKTEDGLEDYDDEEDNEDRGNTADGNYARNKNRRDVSSQRKYNYKKELECASCNKRCSSKHALAKHMEQHVKDEEQRATKSAKQKQIAEKRERQRNGGNADLDSGDKKDDDYDSDFESGLDWPMDNHECAKCKKRYSTKKSLLRHQLLHEEPNFECDICNVKFYRKDKLKAHYDKCSEKNPDQVRKCNICGDSFENNEILREHRSKHVTEGILTEEDLRDIEPRAEEKKPGEKIGRKRRTDIVGLECTECNKQYTSRKGLLRHIQVHEGKKYLCDICPKKFYRREHLKIHVAKHNMIKPYKCTRCTKRFIKEDQLTNHLSKHDRTFKKNKETDSSKRFLCEICSKSFTQSTTLIAHLRAHNGIKPYVCEVCSRPFTTNAYLKMHMRTHTQERPYICQYCSRAFARADTLANHLTSHTGEAKYHCKYCPKNFRRLKSLKEHVFIHTGQRPYACPTCDRRFNNNGSRYAHSKRCKQNFLQNQNQNQNQIRGQALTAQVQPVQNQQRVLQQAAALAQAQVIKAQNIKTITITRQTDAVAAAAQQAVMQHQEILMPLILPLTVTLADVGEEVILPEGTKIFTTSKWESLETGESNAAMGAFYSDRSKST